MSHTDTIYAYSMLCSCIETFSQLYVNHIDKSCYGKVDGDWQVIGLTPGGARVLIKEYKKQDNAYRYLEKVIGGRV